MIGRPGLVRLQKAACPVGPADRTGVAPEDGTGIGSENRTEVIPALWNSKAIPLVCGLYLSPAYFSS